MSLHLSKYHIVGNHVSRLIYFCINGHTPDTDTRSFDINDYKPDTDTHTFDMNGHTPYT